MYKDQVETLTFEQIPLEFKDEKGRPISKNDLVIDYATQLVTVDSPFLPDLAITGYFQMINKNAKNQFIIMKDGPHALFLTGVPQGNTEIYKLNNPINITYWQDTNIGYLFQVVNIDKTDTYLSKKQKTK